MSCASSASDGGGSAGPPLATAVSQTTEELVGVEAHHVDVGGEAVIQRVAVEGADLHASIIGYLLQQAGLRPYLGLAEDGGDALVFDRLRQVGDLAGAGVLVGAADEEAHDLQPVAAGQGDEGVVDGDQLATGRRDLFDRRRDVGVELGGPAAVPPQV